MHTLFRQKEQTMREITLGGKMIAEILEDLGVTIEDVIVIVNGKIERNPERVIQANDRIMIMPALEGG